MDKFEKPRSNEDVSRILGKASNCIEEKNYEKALIIFQRLINYEGTQIAGYRGRSDVWQAVDQEDLAIADLNKAIELGSGEPADCYHLGILYYKIGNYDEAINAFSKGILYGDESDFDYYTGSCLFHRAALYLKAGNIDMALKDCDDIEDEYSVYLPREGVKTKADLVRSAKEHK